MTRKLSFWEGIKAQFSTKCLVLIPIAVGINLIGGTLCSALKLPLFLDMIGTIVVACLSGPWVAALTGLLTNLFLALVANPVYLLCGGVGIVRFGRRLYGQGRTVPQEVGRRGHLAGVHVRQCDLRIADHHIRIRRCHRRQRYIGADGNAGLAMKDILASVISSSLIENLLDKGITVAIAWVIVQKIPRRFLSQYAADSMGGSDNDALSDDDEEEDK